MEAIMSTDFQNYFIIIFLCLLSIVFYFLFVKKPKASRLGLNLPPSPPSLPIIGHLHLLLSLHIHKKLQKLSAKYGPLLHLRIFNYPVVLVSSASVAYEIFRVHDVNVSFRGFVPVEDTLLFGTSGFISAPYGDYWKFMKKITVTKLFGPHGLEQTRDIRTDEVYRCYTNLLDKATKMESVEIGQVAMKLNVDSICRIIMGSSCLEDNGETENVMELVTRTFALSKKMMLANILRRPLQKLGISLFKKEIMGLTQGFDKVIEKIIVEHEENPDKHNGRGMMDALVEAYRDENAEYKITKKHIKCFVVEMFVGGSDTAAQTTRWIMAEIINKPNILKRLREEIDSVVGKTRLIQETDLPNLTYLQAIVKEGLRMHPPAPIFPRESIQGCKIGEFYIPEKTVVVVNPYAIMRDPDYWEDPDEFKPERFLKDQKSERALKYIPFGSGRRGCPAENLAHALVGTAIGMMVQGFEWRMKEEKVNLEEGIAGISLSMAHPTKFTHVSRTLNPLQHRKL